MYTYKAKILSVYDGDGSFKAEIDMGMNIRHIKDIRLYGVDTPEIRGEQREAGLIVRDFVRELILDKEVVIFTKKDKTGKYGRLLAEISFLENNVYKDLAGILLEKKYAKPYFGGTKEKWLESEISFIANIKN